MEALEKEILELRHNNALLERNLIANVLCSNGKQGKFNGWIADACANVMGEDVFPVDENGTLGSEISLMAKTTSWSMLDNCACKTQQNGSKRWCVAFTHKGFPGIRVDFEFSTHDDVLNRRRITDLAINVSSAVTLCEGECDALVSVCESQNDPSLFLSQFVVYLQLSEARVSFIDGENIGDFIDEDGRSIQITLKNESFVVARVNWSISMCEFAHAVEESYSVVFTQKGKQLAEKFHFPDEIICQGRYKNWSVRECLTNMSRLAGFDDGPTSPKKTNQSTQ